MSTTQVAGSRIIIDIDLYLAVTGTQARVEAQARERNQDR